MEKEESEISKMSEIKRNEKSDGVKSGDHFLVCSANIGICQPNIQFISRRSSSVNLLSNDWLNRYRHCLKAWPAVQIDEAYDNL